MSFRDDLMKFKRKVVRREEQIANHVGTLVYESVVEGSSVTSAPGQPVDTGALKKSWKKADVPYASFIEEGEYTQRSSVGGPHSRKLTVAGFKRLVKQANDEVPK
jgi:hypothetical protein